MRLLSTSTLSEDRMALTTTTFPEEGRTETEPYGLLTETPDRGPTLKRYSLCVSAARGSAVSVTASVAPSNASSSVLPPIVFPDFQFTFKIKNALGPDSWSLQQSTIQRQLKQHGLLLVGLHQRAPSFLVVGICGHVVLLVLNILVDPPQVIRVLSPERRSLLRHFLQQVGIVEPGIVESGDRAVGASLRHGGNGCRRGLFVV